MKISAIKYFMNTSVSDLEYVFGENNFAFFFYKLLNPKLDSSFLMKDNFQKNIEKLRGKVEILSESQEARKLQWSKIVLHEIDIMVDYRG